jgi:hypothetical protein
MGKPRVAGERGAAKRRAAAEALPDAGFRINHESEAEFDPLLPVGPGNQIPHACIWRTHSYPGPLPKQAFKGSTPRRLQAAGVLIGRPLEEILAILGRVSSRSSIGNGQTLYQWMSISTGWSPSYHYSLIFDRYQICAGLEHEWVE